MDKQTYTSSCIYGREKVKLPVYVGHAPLLFGQVLQLNNPGVSQPLLEAIALSLEGGKCHPIVQDLVLHALDPQVGILFHSEHAVRARASETILRLVRGGHRDSCLLCYFWF